MQQELLSNNSEIITYPRTVKENLIFRAEFHQQCEQSYLAQEAAARLFTIKPTAFFNLCLFTYDPRVPECSDRPFITYPFQDDYIAQGISKDIDDGESSLTEKTRDMGVSWMVLGEFLRRFLFKDESFHIGSRKEDLVDKVGDINSLLERIRYMSRALPGWIPQYCKFSLSDMPFMKIFKENGAAITGESMNANFSRQGRYKAILLDEFAHVEHDESIWTACGDSAPCKLVVSTPKGNLNKFARMRKEGKIRIHSLHWRMHPKKTEEWYQKECEGRSADDVAQELDINYNVSAGKPFYHGFRRSLHAIRGLVPVRDKELLCGWDYGFVHPAFVVTQLDARGRWTWFAALLGDREQIESFADRVREFLNTRFPGYTIREYGDPAGNQESDKSKMTTVQQLNRKGFRPVSQPSNLPGTNYAARKNITEDKLSTLIDGLPALMINDCPETQILIEAMEGGYRFADPNKYGFTPETPVRDGYYEHVMNAMEYIEVNCFRVVERKQAPAPRPQPRSRDNI